ncbi:MAG: AAA domain-containing protein [Saprospiraceae bacterium]
MVLDAAQVGRSCIFVWCDPLVLNKRPFQTVFIDEAAQALEPAVWIAISKGKE